MRATDTPGLQARLNQFSLGLRIETPATSSAFKTCYQPFLKIADILCHHVHLRIQVDTIVAVLASLEQGVDSRSLTVSGLSTTPLRADANYVAASASRLFSFQGSNAS
jgi:hypothetical protein